MEGLSTQQCLNSIGLILGMIGVGIIFFYGPPQPNLEEGVAIVVEDNTPLADGRTAAEHDRDVEQLRGRHSLLSKCGLALIFFGFFFQLSGTWIRQDGAQFPNPFRISLKNTLCRWKRKPQLIFQKHRRSKRRIEQNIS